MGLEGEEGVFKVRKSIDCCRNMLQAQEVGTDNEGYGSAVWEIGDGSFRIGIRTGDIAYCPWCGAPVVKE